MLREERRGDEGPSRGRQGETTHRGGRNGAVDGGQLLVPGCESSSQRTRRLVLAESVLRKEYRVVRPFVDGINS
jgi:hypothetical protein